MRKIELEIEEPKRMKNSVKILLIGGSILFILQNIFYYVFAKPLPLDIIASMMYSASFILIFYQTKIRLFFISAISSLGWVIGTSLWRLFVILNPFTLGVNLAGHFQVLIIFGICSLLYFTSFITFINAIHESAEYNPIFNSKKSFSSIYIRIYLLYLILNLIISLGIVVGGIYPGFLVMIELGLFFKIFIIPALGILVFGGLCYLFIQNRKVNQYTKN